MEFHSCLIYTFAILAIDDENEALGTGVIMSPKWPDLILPSYVPHVELDVLISHGLDVKADYMRYEMEKLRQTQLSTRLLGLSSQIGSISVYTISLRK